MVNIMIAKDVHQRGAEIVASYEGREADLPGIGDPPGAFRRVVEDADPYC